MQLLFEKGFRKYRRIIYCPRKVSLTHTYLILHLVHAVSTGQRPFADVSSPTFQVLYPLWVALTTVTWFQALFALSASFLHFYLFFILHIPFSHLVDSRPTLDAHRNSSPISQDGTDRHRHEASSYEVTEEDQVQKEVDIRARCERPPFEEYVWVWWAWWAFRRGPVAHIYALVVGSLSLATVSPHTLNTSNSFMGALTRI